MVVPARHPPRPSGAPRPDHRRHVMDQRQGLAVTAQPLRNPPAEPGAVDRHHRIGPLRADRGDRFAYPAQDRKCLRQHLGHPDHRELVERHQAGKALLAHALAADPGDPQIAAGALSQCRDQPGAQRVARGLAGDNEDERRGSLHAEPHQAERMPTTKSPARSAISMTSSRSSTIVAPASMAIPLSPASAASVTVCRPIVGRSARCS